MNEMQLTAELETAMSWLQQRRGLAPADADYWHLRHHWATVRPALCAKLLAGTWRLTPMQVVGRFEKKVLWSACDALVLKWVTSRLTPLLPVHPRCEHVKGHGGGRTSIGRLSAALAGGEYRYVFRTDICGYYGAMNKSRVMRQLAQYVDDPVLLDLVSQYLHYTVEDGGEFHTPEKGIARGCPLSPLIGAFHLYTVDVHFAAQKNIVYARYMDDFVILAKSRWSLRRQVKALNECLASHDFEKHPDKTFVGRVEKGFDWLGAWLAGTGVTGIAPRALANHREKVRRLYERLRMWPRARAHARVSQYRSRWKIWAGAVCLSFSWVAGCPAVFAAGLGPWTVASSAPVQPCVPSVILSFAGSGGTYPATGAASGISTTWIGIGPADIDNSYWAGTLIPRADFGSAVLPTAPGGAPVSSAPLVSDHTICGRTVAGILSSDGHAVLYATATGNITQTLVTTGDPVNITFDPSTGAGGALTGGGVGSVASGNFSGCRIDLYQAFAYAAWPMRKWGYVRIHTDPSPGHSDYNLAPCGPMTGHLPQVDFHILWDGVMPASDDAYDIKPYTFRAVLDLQDAGAEAATNPAVHPNLVTAPPTCSALVPNGSAVAFGPLTAGETPRVASTVLTVSCSAAGASAPAVRPLVSWSADTNGSSGPWSIATSSPGVFITGNTDANSPTGPCWYPDHHDLPEDYLHGSIDFSGTKPWHPFTNLTDPSAPWGSYDPSVDGLSWSKSATIYWGVCARAQDGAISGPFNASATWSLTLK